MPVPRDRTSIPQHVAFAGELSRWIERAGVKSGEAIGDLAVGFADILHAAALAEPHLDAMLALDPADPAGADAALTHLAHLNALFVTEIKAHAEDLDRRWSELEDRLVATAPDDEPDDDTDASGV